MYQRQARDPRTKEEVLDRMLAYDFNGDVRDIGAETARLVRTAANKLLLHFPVSGRTYELTVRLPRKEQIAKARTTGEPRSFAPKDETPPKQEVARKTRPSRRVTARQSRTQHRDHRPQA